MRERKDRKQMRQEDQRHYDSLESKTNIRAREWFHRPAYKPWKDPKPEEVEMKGEIQDDCESN